MRTAAVDDRLLDGLLDGLFPNPARATAAADALDALSYNVGVPRDMDKGPADALRAVLRLLAAKLGRGAAASVDGKWARTANG